MKNYIPLSYFKQATKLRKLNFKKFLQTQSALHKVNVKLSDLQLPLKLTKWVKKPKLTLFLVGDTRTGKTLFWKALAQEKQFNILQINRVDGLRDITQDHQMLVFDHFNFKNMREQKLFSLLDTEHEHLITLSRGSVEKPKGLVQIVTLYPEQLKPLIKRLNEFEFLSQIYIVELYRPILHNLELNKDV